MKTNQRNIAALGLLIFAHSLSGCGKQNSSNSAFDPDVQGNGAGTPSESASSNTAFLPGSATTHTPDWLSPETRQAIERYRDPEFYGALSPQSYRWIGQELREKVDAEAHSAGRLPPRNMTRQSLPEGVNWETHLSGLRNDFEENKKEIEFGKEMIQGVRDFTVGTLKAGTAVATASGIGIPEALILGAVTEGTDRAFVQVLKAYEREAGDAARGLIAIQLQKLPEQVGREWDALTEKSPEEARAFVLKQVSSWSNAAGANRSPVIQAAMDSILLKTTLGELAHEKSLNRLRNADIKEDQAQLLQRIQAVSGALTGYASETNHLLEEVVQSQGELATQLEGFMENISTLQTDASHTRKTLDEANSKLNFLSQFLFSRMNTAEQRAAIEGGVIEGIPEKDRLEQLTKLDSISKREKLERDLGELLNGAQALIHLGQTFGVKPQVISEAQRIVSLTSSATSVAGALATGNWLEAANEIGRLFGMNAPDVGQSRHREVMNALGALSEGQEALYEGQQVLLSHAQASIELEKQILENQGRTLQGLVNLSEQIQEGHLQVLKQIDYLRQDARISQGMMREIGLEKFRGCARFLQSREQVSGYIRFKQAFANSQARRAHFNEYLPEFRGCVEGIEGLLQESNQTHSYLTLESHGQIVGAGKLIEKQFNPTFSLTSELLGNSRGYRKGLLLPLQKTHALDSSTSDRNEELDAIRTPTPFSDQQLSQLLATDLLKELTSHLLEVLPYLDLVEFHQESKLPSLHQILSGTGVKRSVTRPERLLNSALKHVNLAIAQESLMAGSGLLSRLNQEWNEKSDLAARPCQDSSSPGDINCVLAHNPTLTRNLVLFSVGAALRKRSHSIYSYEFMRHFHSDPQKLREFLGNGWNFEFQDGEWQVVIAGQRQTLPSALELHEDRMLYRSEMTEMIQLRSALANRIAEIQMMRSEQDQRNYELGALLFAGF